MATWEDGPEYAPLQRPDDFDVPDVPPLDDAPPLLDFSAGAPLVRPQFAGPTNPAKPLAALAPDEAEHRDPQLPFAVAASSTTANDSAWGSAHWSPPGGIAVNSGIAVDGSWAPPTTAPAGVPAAMAYGSWPAAPIGPVPTDPIMMGQRAMGPETMGPGAMGSATPDPFGPPPQPAGQFPVPGSPRWFGPGPVGGQRPIPTEDPIRTEDRAKALLEAATPQLLAVLVISGLYYPLSPFLFCLAFALSTKVTVAKVAIHRLFLTLGCVGGLLALIGLTAPLASVWDWYHFVGIWALALSWVALILTLAIIYREQQRRARPQPPQYSRWG